MRLKFSSLHAENNATVANLERAVKEATAAHDAHAAAQTRAAEEAAASSRRESALSAQVSSLERAVADKTRELRTLQDTKRHETDSAKQRSADVTAHNDALNNKQLADAQAARQLAERELSEKKTELATSAAKRADGASAQNANARRPRIATGH